MNTRNLLVYGSREFGRVVRLLAEDCGFSVVGYVDDYSVGAGILGTWDDCRRQFDPGAISVAIAVGYRSLSDRWSVYQKVRDCGFSCPALIHPAAYVHESACIGAGSFVMGRGIIDVRCQLGELVVVWPGAVISHDTGIEANVFVSPGATLCGACRIGRDSFVGAGAVIVDHVAVAASAFIRAGQIVTGRERRDGV